MWFRFKKDSGLYEVWADYPDPYRFPDCWVTNIHDVDVRWDAGQPIERPVPDTITYEVDKTLPLMDLMEAGSWVLVSDRLAEFINNMSSCAVFYNSEVQYKGNVVRRDCKTVNFTASFPCLDMKRSRFSKVGVLRRVVIDKAKIPRNEHLFRPREYVVALFADQTFVDAVQTQGFTGLRFETQ